MKRLKIQIKKQRRWKPAKPKVTDGTPNNILTGKTMIFQEMKQLKAQIQTKRWKTSRNQNLGWKTKQQSTRKNNDFSRNETVKGTNPKQKRWKTCKNHT
jgi:hypothetical protein